MRRHICIVIMTSLALFWASVPQTGQAKECETEIQLKVKSDEAGKSSIYGYRPVKKTISNTKDLGTGRSKRSRSRTAEVPQAYDAREEGLLTVIKDQGTLEICWAYAVMGASETAVLQKGLEENPDLSEYHLAYSAYNKALDPLGLTAEDKVCVREMSNDAYYWGGNAYLALSALARWQGEVAEETAPVEMLKESIADGRTAVLPENLMFSQNRYLLQNAEFIFLTDENRDRIKQKLMQKGAASISLHVPENEEEERRYSNTGNNEFTALHCDNPSLETNHEVLVVGWDDDYAVSNFNPQCRPSEPGAWLLRNSWGDYNGLGGYFWLSYEDAMLQVENNDAAEVVFYEVEPANHYDHNYQYDTGMPTRYVSGCHSIANVYTAQQNELLRAASFFTQESGMQYSISVYRNTEPNNPSSGTKVGNTLTGTVEERGYHTIVFSEAGGSDIPLSKGDRFSIVLRLTDPEGRDVYYTYESDMGMPEMEDIVAAETGESFLTADGAHWIDFSNAEEVGFEGANFCLKAFTTDVEGDVDLDPTQPPVLSPDPSSAPEATPDPTPIVLTPSTQTSGTVKETSDPLANESGKTNAIVKKLIFKPGTKTVKAGKKLKLSSFLKITKYKKGTPKIVYEFTKKKYKKYATLSKKGVIKAKKAGRKHTLYVRARARDGSGKTAKMKIKIK